jgi:hypothetical protein
MIFSASASALRAPVFQAQHGKIVELLRIACEPVHRRPHIAKKLHRRSIRVWLRKWMQGF